MLVLARKLDQSIQIGDDITVTIVAVKGNTVRIGISAPDHIRVTRSELQLHSDAPPSARPFKAAESFPAGEFRSGADRGPRSMTARSGLSLAQRAERLSRRRPGELARSMDEGSSRPDECSPENRVAELTTRPAQPVTFRPAEQRLPLTASADQPSGPNAHRAPLDSLPERYEVQHLRISIETPTVAETTQG